jgi:hypothetical protein
MMQRCYNRRDRGYANYGGRGIQVEEYLHSPENYVQYVKSLPSWSENMEIDRINNEGNYERGNLRCISKAQNLANTRKTRRVVWEGQEMCWAEFVRNHTQLSTTRALIYLRKGWSLAEITSYVPLMRGRRCSGV